jgi:hypothetical protein
MAEADKDLQKAIDDHLKRLSSQDHRCKMPLILSGCCNYG